MKVKIKSLHKNRLKVYDNFWHTPIKNVELPMLLFFSVFFGTKKGKHLKCR